MRSYVKVFGPPLLKALKALRGVAIEMPEVCIMDTTIRAAKETPKTGKQVGAKERLETKEDVKDFFKDVGEVSEERCGTLISRSSQTLGEYDFYFEWYKKPSMSQIEDLIERIDEALMPLGVEYTLTSK
jgi:hypothetical protein